MHSSQAYEKHVWRVFEKEDLLNSSQMYEKHICLRRRILQEFLERNILQETFDRRILQQLLRSIILHDFLNIYLQQIK